MVKEIKFNAVDQCNPSFSAFGLWTHPRDQAIHYTGPEDWMDYAPARAGGCSTIVPGPTYMGSPPFVQAGRILVYETIRRRDGLGKRLATMTPATTRRTSSPKVFIGCGRNPGAEAHGA